MPCTVIYQLLLNNTGFISLYKPDKLQIQLKSQLVQFFHISPVNLFLKIICYSKDTTNTL